jgi:hypothetical protein
MVEGRAVVLGIGTKKSNKNGNFGALPRVFLGWEELLEHK